MTRLAVAHRTTADPAQARARAACGATVFEVDVRLHRGDVVSSHGRLRRRLRLVAGPRLHLGLPARTPTLAAVLDAVPPDAEVLLDLKDDRPEPARLLAQALRDTLPDPARCYASTHDWASLSHLSAAGVRAWRTLGTPASVAALLAVGLQDAWGVTVRAALLEDPRTCDALLQAADGRVVAWTVNRTDQARRLLDRGVLGLTTDRCEVLGLVRA